MSCDLFSNLLHALQNLMTTVSKDQILYLYNLADKVFFAIVELEMEQIMLGEEEKAELGPLIHQSLSHLENDIENKTDMFPSINFESACRIRSGLQFLLDNYSNYFPKEELERAGERISIFRENLDLDDLDGSLRKYTLPEYDSMSKVSKTLAKLEDMGLKDKHFWWWL